MSLPEDELHGAGRCVVQSEDTGRVTLLFEMLECVLNLYPLPAEVTGMLLSWQVKRDVPMLYYGQEPQPRARRSICDSSLPYRNLIGALLWIARASS